MEIGIPSPSPFLLIGAGLLGACSNVVVDPDDGAGGSTNTGGASAEPVACATLVEVGEPIVLPMGLADAHHSAHIGFSETADNVEVVVLAGMDGELHVTRATIAPWGSWPPVFAAPVATGIENVVDVVLDPGPGTPRVAVAVDDGAGEQVTWLLDLAAPAEGAALIDGASPTAFLRHNGDTSLLSHTGTGGPFVASYSPATGVVQQTSSLCPTFVSSAIVMPEGFMTSSSRAPLGSCNSAGNTVIDRYGFGGSGALERSDGALIDGLFNDGLLVPRDGGAWLFAREEVGSNGGPLLAFALDEAGQLAADPIVVDAEPLSGGVQAVAALGSRAVVSTHADAEKGLVLHVLEADGRLGPSLDLFPDRVYGADPAPQLVGSSDGKSLLVMRQVSAEADTMNVALHRVDCAP